MQASTNCPNVSEPRSVLLVETFKGLAVILVSMAIQLAFAEDTYNKDDSFCDVGPSEHQLSLNSHQSGRAIYLILTWAEFEQVIYLEITECPSRLFLV